MKHILTIVFILLTTLSHAQVAIPFGFTSEEKNKLIRENDSVKFYTATRDTARMVSINEETYWYRLLNKKDRSVIAEGSFMIDDEKYMQDGKAVAHYPDGVIKLAGFYRRGKPVGLWQSYYPGGQLKNIDNYAIMLDDGGFSSCYSGSHQEFYESGKLKVNGFYAAKMTEVFDTVEVEDPVTNEFVQKTVSRMSYAPQKTGRWEYYNELGELTKKEDY